MLRVLALSLVLTTAVPATGWAANPSPSASVRQPSVAITEHQGVFNGRKVRYTATVAETFLNDEAGKPAAFVVTTAYVRKDVKDAAKRPVLFLFNGGPGASTTPLHFGAFGPYRRVDDGDAQRMVPNPDSPLDTVDLVFIDPVGTGYSRTFPGVDGKPFWSRTGDAMSVKTVMETWAKTHGREASPRYMLGQSYGTTRAAMVLKVAPELNLDGVLLFALVANPAGREMPYVASLPSFATTAWYHRKIDRKGRTVKQVYDEAVEFARTDYVTALIRGGSLPEGEKREVAERMSGLIGLPAEFILEKDLRLTKPDFMFNLLKDQGLRTGQLDGRATARLDAPPQRPPYDDPGINYNPGKSTDAQPPAGPGTATSVDAYFKDVLKFGTAETYNALNLDVNSAWDYEGGDDVNPFIGRAMKADPKLRLFWAAGYFDITTAAYGGRYALDQAGVPGDRLTAAYFEGGHSVFTDEGNLTALSNAVRTFVSPAR